ncbi:hypothetical protein [Candidatus Paracaedibacter symbiosus]|uniref:hypothetical protein n=1 Tax=Candidatus Paracaedibacter symbiosus TaxID=244582 RepID=UPI000509B6A4|nr:hypothetical protein [Candidatus Paracaedibacter symbiosus]
MDILDNKESRKASSFQIRPKPRSDKEFYFTGEDNFFGFEGEADLVIKSAPLFLSDILVVGEEILVCQNVKFNKDQCYSRLFERHFLKLISKALEELYRFSMFHQLPGALILLSQEEITPLTELQKHWLKDFVDLFSFVELSPKSVHQLYLPTNLISFQNYCELHALLEQSISSTSSPLSKI